jgi:hypothetical protein
MARPGLENVLKISTNNTILKSSGALSGAPDLEPSILDSVLHLKENWSALTSLQRRWILDRLLPLESEISEQNK